MLDQSGAAIGNRPFKTDTNFSRASSPMVLGICRGDLPLGPLEISVKAPGSKQRRGASPLGSSVSSFKVRWRE
jgi:hypothetical protein